MDIIQAGGQQLIDTNRRPFKDNVFDYSGLDNAEVLDAFAASLLLICLTAAVTHFAALLLGMTTTSVIVSSLLEKYLFPNLVCLLHIRKTDCDNGRNNRRYLILQALAGGFLSLLLLAEALIIFSNAPYVRKIKLEDLQIKWPQLSTYDGALKFKDIPDNCYNFYSAQRSLTVDYLTFCVQRYSPPQPSLPNDTIRLSLIQTNNSLFEVYRCEINGNGTRLHMLIPVQIAMNATAVNSSKLVNNATEVITWLGNRVKPLLGCNSSSSRKYIVGINNLVDEVNLTNCKNITETSCTGIVDRAMFSTLTFSSSSLSRQDIVQARHDTDSNTALPSKVPTDINWDQFASFQKSRIPGYIILLAAIFMFFLNIVLGAYAPDLQHARQVAASQYLALENIPANLSTHKIL